ncbi:MAG: HEAT repeat domain-containing protein [Planctomycetota bacterium]
MPRTPETSTRRQRLASAGWLTLAALAAVACCAGVAVYADWYRAAPPDALRQATYVGRQSCVACHQQQHAEWTGSHHDKAMDLATDRSVLGDFNNAEFTRLGLTTRFFRDGPRFMVNTEGPDGELADFEVKYTFGVDPLQQYMVEFEDGRVQVLRVSWDTRRRRWFYLTVPGEADSRLEPGDPFHWTGVTQNWNTTCAVCHSTQLEKNYDLATDTYNTAWSEIDVSCEACHGPASLHVELAGARSLFWDRRHGYGLAKLKGLDPTAQVESCVKCHARHANPIHSDFRPGTPVLDSYEPATLREGLYHADGQILDEVYVYGSFLQSKMHAQGVRCSDCHNPHSLELEAFGNQMCAKCHQPAQYDVVSHHHHPDPQPGVRSAGASCIACHMTSRVYMDLDERHDHSFRIPRPDLTVAIGTPTACNTSHTEKKENAEWAASKVRDWYGDRSTGADGLPKDAWDRAPHWGLAIAAGRAGEAGGEEKLIRLARRNTAPAIARATAVELLQRYPTPGAQRAVAAALESPEPLVRIAAARSIGPLTPDPQERATLLAPLVTDPIAGVRIAAARALAPAPPSLLSRDQERGVAEGLEAFRHRQAYDSDRGGAHRALANLARELGDRQTTIDELRLAIRLEPYFAGPRDELALTLDPRRDAEEIARLRREEIERLRRDTAFDPTNHYGLFRLGVLLAVTGSVQDAAGPLRQACELAPTAADYHNALATVLFQRYATTGDPAAFADAVDAIKRLHAVDDTPARAEGYLRGLIARKKAFEAAASAAGPGADPDAKSDATSDVGSATEAEAGAASSGAGAGGRGSG